jgi:hypothetical protein
MNTLRKMSSLLAKSCSVGVLVDFVIPAVDSCRCRNVLEIIIRKSSSTFLKYKGNDCWKLFSKHLHVIVNVGVVIMKE